MEAAGLQYMSNHRLIICLEHRRGVVATGVSNHLRREHQLKGQALQAALEEVEQLRPQPVEPTALPAVAHGTLHIPEIKSTTAYHCVLEHCNLEREALSSCRRTVEKHQGRVHRINKGRQHRGRSRRDTQVVPYQIATVRIQSLLPRPHERPYIIQEAVYTPRERLEAQSSTFELAQIDKDLETARECDRSLYGRVPVEATQAQLLPWLVWTGISNHLSGMAKETVQALVGSATHGKA